jgi:hemerythrin-like domain-containing protein
LEVASMRITERLKAEHGVLLFQLRHLQDLVRLGASLEVLKAVVDTIANADDRHSGMEARLLYPALAMVVGPESPLLQRSKAAHEELRRLRAWIDAGVFDSSTVDAYAERLRDHLEREIHDVFAVVEDSLPAERLAAMSSWDVDHIHEVNARREGGAAPSSEACAEPTCRHEVTG